MSQLMKDGDDALQYAPPPRAAALPVIRQFVKVGAAPETQRTPPPFWSVEFPMKYVLLTVGRAAAPLQ